MAKQPLQPLPDPDDMFADTRMSFGDHIEDLRSHLIRAIVGFVLGLIICVLPWIGQPLVKFVTYPIEQQLKEFYLRNTKSGFTDVVRGNLAKDVRPVRMPMLVHVPTLKRILEGKKPDATQHLDDIVADLDEMLLQIGLEFDAGDRSNDPDWASLRVELPDLIGVSKTVTEIYQKARPKGLTTLTVQEAFIVYFKVCIMFGFVLSSPWVFYQLWSFVAVGLYPSEKRLVNHYLPISLGLFLAGFFVCEFLALPKAIEALLWFNEWLGFEPELRLNEWLSFAIIMPLVFGISFQTPIVMMFLYKIGVADIDTFRNKRRISYFLMAIFAAVITPSTDVPTMMLLWVPMCLLYECGIWLCKMQPPSPADEMDESELDEMVGV